MKNVSVLLLCTLVACGEAEKVIVLEKVPADLIVSTPPENLATLTAKLGEEVEIFRLKVTAPRKAIMISEIPVEIKPPYDAWLLSSGGSSFFNDLRIENTLHRGDLHGPRFMTSENVLGLYSVMVGTTTIPSDQVLAEDTYTELVFKLRIGDHEDDPGECVGVTYEIALGSSLDGFLISENNVCFVNDKGGCEPIPSTWDHSEGSFLVIDGNHRYHRKLTIVK